jgi:hypothetical protein
VILVAFAGACGGETSRPADAGFRDGGGIDGGLADGGLADGGVADGGRTDGGIDPVDPRNPTRDSDCDGLSDAEELSTTYPGRRTTDPLNPDTDGDGIPDGVEVGRTASVDPNCTSFVGDADPTTRTDPTNPDSDADGVPDGTEDANRNGRVDPGETDPRDRDSDRDGVVDRDDACPTVRGLPANRGCPSGIDGGAGDGGLADSDGDGLTDQDEVTVTGTDPRNPDTDGDGLTDGAEVLVHHTNPNRVDTDCDGLTDADEVSRTYAGGRKTNPLSADTDGDGIPDGVEAGVTVNPDPVNCPNVRLDADPATTTDPTSPDSDGDGLADGIEDRNQNGRVDPAGDGGPAETDPNNPSDGQAGDGGVVAQACRTDQLREVLFKAETSYNVQTARVPSFAEVRDVAVNGTGVGALYFDATNGIAAFALTKVPAGATVLAEETAARAVLDGIGAVGAPVTQSITTWDGLPAVLGRYDWNATGDLKSDVNAAVTGLLGNPAGLTGLFPDMAGMVGPYKLRVEYVRRSAQQAVIVGALARSSGFDAQQEIRLQDLANGTALADAYDEKSAQCDRFLSAPLGKVDFLWVIDNSGSMGDDQDALSAAATEVATQLGNASLDWRMAVAYTDLHLNPSSTTSADTCPGAPGPGRRRICPFTRNIDQFRNGTAQCAYVKAGTCGSGSERGFHGARIAIETFLGIGSRSCEPVPGAECNLRPDAQLVVIFFTDTGDQTTAAPPGQPDNSVGSWASYFGDYDPNRSGAQRALVHGILCPGRQSVTLPDGGVEGPCTDNLLDPALYDRYSQLVSRMGGVEGSIRDSDQAQLPQTITQILNAVIAQVSPYQLTRPPISATLKVVMQKMVSGQLQVVEVPRHPTDGFEFDGAENSVVLRGSFLPDAPGRDIAVSYRYWVDRQPPTTTCPPCSPPRTCNPGTGQCECPASCDGSPQPSPRHRCDPLTCTWACDSACNGTCSSYQTCNTESCACECVQSASCPPGFRFSPTACDCICDTEALGCNLQRYDLDPLACTCTCKPDCGGCAASSPCNTSVCRCIAQ